MSEQDKEAAREAAKNKIGDFQECIADLLNSFPPDDALEILWCWGFDAGYNFAMSQFVSIDELPSISKMDGDELREYLAGMGSVTAKYDPERRKNIVSIEPPTES